MSKKRKNNPKDSPMNIHNISIEIDYDKLADAIIKAQQKADEPVQEIVGRKDSILKNIWGILRGKKDTNDQMTMGFMALPIMILFKGLSIVGFFVSIVSFIGIIRYAMTWAWSGWNIINYTLVLFILAALLFIILLYSIMIWGAANEMDNTEDKHFVAAVFSGMVSLVALIVSLIALKG